MKEFCCKTKIISGAGAVSKLSELGAKKIFLITDPFFKLNGEADRVASTSKAQQVKIFDKVQPDPSVELVAAGVAEIKEFNPDLIVALGGGSAIDCAKAIKFFAKNKNTMVVIPTTSGSGSEVTDFAILTHSGVKHPLVDSVLRPDIAILDSDFLADIPAGLIADSGFDVLSHALEAYVAVNSGTITECLAREAFSMAYTALPLSFAGQKSVRLKMHEASCLAGMAFTRAGLGICHALSHALGGTLHIPHGRLNAILLPSVIAYNAGCAGKRYAEIARSAGIGGTDTIAVRNLINGLIRLRRELKLPETLVQAGADPKVVQNEKDNIVCAAMADICCKTNPAAAEKSVMLRILEEVTGRG